MRFYISTFANEMSRSVKLLLTSAISRRLVNGKLWALFHGDATNSKQRRKTRDLLYWLWKEKRIKDKRRLT